VLPVRGKYTIVATWAGELFEHSAKVTTFDTADAAHETAQWLTVLSESAWDNMVWCDTRTLVGPIIGSLVNRLRNHETSTATEDIDITGYRHADSDSFDYLNRMVVGSRAELTRPQKLSIADEIELDHDHRRFTLTHGGLEDPEHRGWQAGLVTRIQEFGSMGSLPDGAAALLADEYGRHLEIEDRWAARDQILRIEQLHAACKESGGRAGSETDPLGAHCVVVHSEDELDTEIFYVAPDQFDSTYHDPQSMMTIRRSTLGVYPVEVGKVHALDSDGFASAMGEWVKAVPLRR
jgi:hypothetical protein